MDAKIDEMIQMLMRKEGGFSDNPADKGGATNLGITQATLSAYLGRKATRDDIKNVKPEVAREIYYTRYFILPRIDALPQPIQSLMLDMCVNHGAVKAIKIMQRVINKVGIQHVTEDGVCGPETQAAAHSMQEVMGPYFENALVDERINFYRQIVSNTPSQLVFLRGWERRAESFRVAVS